MQKKILKKLFNTTITVFIILTILTINKTSNNNVLRTNLEIENITNISTDKVYLLNKDNLLVKTNIFLAKGKRIENIIKYLTKSNNKTPSGLIPYLPENTKLLNYSKEDSTLTINLSKEFNNTNNLNLQVTGLVYSLLELDDVSNIKIQVEGKPLPKYNETLNKNIGINREYLFNNRYGIKKVVVYYIDKINDKSYYVPVTKYLNDEREKVEIIVDELKTTNNHLISYLNDNVELLNYREEANVLFLNFNKFLLDGDKNVSKDILNTIAYSIFDNYDVNVVYFETDSKKIDLVMKNS